MSISCGGTGQQWTAAGAGALGAADLGVAKAHLEEVTINPTIEPPELTQDWGQTLGGHKQNLVYQDPEERSSDLTRDWPSLPMNVQESLAEAWVGDGLLQDQGHRVQRCMHSTF